MEEISNRLVKGNKAVDILQWKFSNRSEAIEFVKKLDTMVCYDFVRMDEDHVVTVRHGYYFV